MASALAASALALVATAVDVSSSEVEPTPSTARAGHGVRNAHRRPDPPARPPAQADLRLDKATNPPKARRLGLGATPRFEWDALRAHRLQHTRDLARLAGPGIERGRRLDRLISLGHENYLRFGSATLRAGFPTSAAILRG